MLATSTGAATDPFVGKWVMDPKHSDYPVGASPKTMIIEIEATGRGVHYKSHTVFDNGQTTHAEYTADYDGNQVMVTGAKVRVPAAVLTPGSDVDGLASSAERLRPFNRTVMSCKSAASSV